MHDGAPCREQSASFGESIAATAVSDTTTWYLLEYRQTWAAKAPESAELPAAVRERFDAWVQSTPNCRPQLIRRPGRSEEPLSFYVARTGGGVRRYSLERYEDLLELDAPAVADSLTASDQEPSTPILLVCTHGKRDPCCAVFGQPVYERAASSTDFDVWQTSHLGGHRFAATLLFLPLGLCYGRLRPDEVEELLETTRKREIWRLDRFRGQVAQPTAVMAAEHFVREHTGQRSASSFHHESLRALDAGLFEAVIAVGKERWRAVVGWDATELLASPSCGKPPERIRTPRLHALDLIG